MGAESAKALITKGGKRHNKINRRGGEDDGGLPRGNESDGHSVSDFQSGNNNTLPDEFGDRQTG